MTTGVITRIGAISGENVEIGVEIVLSIYGALEGVFVGL